MTIGIAIAVVTVIGFLGAVILVLAAKFMAVEEDPRIEEVQQCLPGANCGACGYAGCADYAKAIVESGTPVNKCVPGGQSCSAQVAQVMGTTAEEAVQLKAVVGCQGKPGVCKQRFEYKGIGTCAAAAMLQGGPKACSQSCLGLGDCERACPFDAIHIVDGIAKVDYDRCTGCGACAKVCPHFVIDICGHTEGKPQVRCNSNEKGPQVMKECDTGCIGCMKCEKTCPSDAIHVKDSLARIDYERCTGCNACVGVCPKKVIIPA